MRNVGRRRDGSSVRLTLGDGRLGRCGLRDGDGLHQFCVGWAHLRNFSKGIGGTAFVECESSVGWGCKGLLRIFTDGMDLTGENSCNGKDNGNSRSPAGMTTRKTTATPRRKRNAGGLRCAPHDETVSGSGRDDDLIWVGIEVWEALKGLLAGSIPCWGFCSMGEVRVLTF